jgi:hypothetical protein
MNLREAQPADVIESSWLEEHERKINLLWQELILLNSNLYVLEKLSKFSTHLFTDRVRGDFLDIVAVNLSSMCAMSIWRLWLDKDKRSLTLERFKDDVAEHVRPEYRQDFDTALENLKWDERALDRVEKFRHKRMAHFDSKCNLSPQERRKLWLSLPALTNLRNTLNRLFEILCFGCEQSVLHIAYDAKIQHPRDMDSRNDVEIVLDAIARNSPILNMPEEQPQAWPFHRQKLSKDDLQALNEYRRKFGLPEA